MGSEAFNRDIAEAAKERQKERRLIINKYVNAETAGDSSNTIKKKDKEINKVRVENTHAGGSVPPLKPAVAAAAAAEAAAAAAAAAAGAAVAAIAEGAAAAARAAVAAAAGAPAFFICLFL